MRADCRPTRHGGEARRRAGRSSRRESRRARGRSASAGLDGAVARCPSRGHARLTRTMRRSRHVAVLGARAQRRASRRSSSSLLRWRAAACRCPTGSRIGSCASTTAQPRRSRSSRWRSAASCEYRARRAVARRPRALHRSRHGVERRRPPLDAPDRRRDHPEYFAVLGWAPAPGRAFTDSDLRRARRARDPERPRVADRLRGDPGDCRPSHPAQSRVVDRRRRACRAGFQHVGGEYRSPPQGDTVDVWLPLAIDGGDGDLTRLALLQRHRADPRRVTLGRGAAGAGGAGRRRTRSAYAEIRDVGRSHRAAARRGDRPLALAW